MAKQSRAIEVTEHDNKCPECLHLEISGEPVASESKGPFSLFKKSEPEAFSLSVRINFNQQWLVFSFGRVKFGLRGGELRLKLENGQMPSELRNEALKKILARELEIERQSGGEQESKSQVEASVTPDLSKASLKGVGEQRQKKSQVDKFQLKIAQVSHKGANNQPVWVFENRTGEPVLIGELADSLGKMLIAGVPWSVEATFTHEMRQVVITGLENLFKDDISGHKLNVFELAVAKLFLKHKTQPYLSRQVLRYE
ncbi:MAG: hypothetical protein GPJ20_22550 [Microcystis aeruginosa BS13-10]|uniref:Uncharacterized protein n=1 Tax=Microcystis aeruginosa G11-04 TaxID=2685956 RepID=A0A966G320_MICAE|nr:hypothetical protein [Microcystis aeruginosa LE13-04]NCS41520.1 hypothetical protein [Microcystis aeruginosa BS13-10]NCS59324.1 hypothetical protein [Microcystis aeruginosa G11-04]NCT45673.1 hypothetical protein [Microcystis aeruginosa G11-09]